MNDEKNRPIHEIRLGRIKAAIWQNQSEHGTRFSVAITRIYRKEDRWQSTTSFGRDDLPLVAKVADMTHTWLFENGNGYRGGNSTFGENNLTEAPAESVDESAAF